MALLRIAGLRAVLLGLLLAGAALVGLLVCASPASAHARLLEVRPADGARVEGAPERVTLRFDEPVVAAAGGVRVYDDDGQRVDVGATDGDPLVIGARLEDDLRPGTYVVTYRVTSADGHPLRGASLFVVGDEQADESLLAVLFAAQDDRGAEFASILVRWAAYATTLVAGGLALCAAALRSAGAPVDVGRAVRLAALAAAVLAAGQVAAQAALVTGDGLAALVDPAALGRAAGGPVGQSAGLRVLALAALVAATRTATRSAGAGGGADAGSWLAAGAGAVAVLSFAVEGHTRTTGPAFLVWTADLVHLGAAAVWIGGLVALALALRGGRVGRDPVGTARAVAAVSGLAGWSVLALVLAGLALGWAEVRALRALVTTPYGWTLLAKLVAVAPVAAAAAYNRRRLVPAVLTAGRPVPAGGAVDAGGRTDPAPAETVLREPARAVATLRRSLLLELVGIAAVLGVTAVLVGLQPAAEAAGVTGAYSTAVPLGADGSEINLTVDPNRAGSNEIHVYVLGPDGRQVDVVDAPTVTFELPSDDIGPLRRTPTRLGPGHFLVAGPELSLPGTWDVTIAVPLSRLEVPEVTIAVPVNP